MSLSPGSAGPAVLSSAIHDDDRLTALSRYRVLDTEAEPAFDRIARLAAAHFDVSMSIVNFVADDRQWFKSTVGVDEQETGLDVSFCVYTVAHEGVFVVEDLAADERFAGNPYVAEDGVRFYAGAPLTTPDGEQIGTLCILDTEPRSPSADALDRLVDLAAMVMDELELRREHRERKRTAETLHRSRELLRQSQQLAQVGGWEYDVERTTLSWTNQTFRIHGLSPDRDIDVETALSFYTPEARPVIEAHFRELIDDGGSYDLSLQIVDADGTKRWVRTIGKAHRVDGKTVRVSGAIQDITDRRRAQQERRNQNEREKRLRLLKAAIEHTRAQVLITKADSLDEPGPRIVYANAAFTDVTGYEEDEVRGQSPRLLQGPDTDRASLDRIREALERNEPVREIVRNYTKDGTMYWNDVYIAPVPDDRGEVTHYVSVQNDVTDRVRRRDELKEAKEAAEEANRIKTALLRNMNHEFRTPLTSILSFSKLLESSPDLAEDFAPRILGGGRRLLRTLNTVMDFAQLEGDQVGATPKRVQLGEVAASVVADFQDLGEREGIDLVIENPDAPIHGVADHHFLERALTHLVDNAVKFTEEGTVTVTLRMRADAAELRVSDPGIGIPADKQERVFDQFYQVSTGNDRTHEGNGLGLTIAARMVERMGGTLNLDSTPGEGTTVAVRVPRDAGGSS